MLEDLSFRLNFLNKPQQITRSEGNIKCHNHMANNYVLGNKKAMFYNMK